MLCTFSQILRIMNKSFFVFLFAAFICTNVNAQSIKPSYYEMGGMGKNYRNHYSSKLKMRTFVEVMAVNSLSGGLGIKLYKNRLLTFETSFHYDVLRSVSIAKSGFHFNIKPLHLGLECAYVNNFHHGLVYMPAYFGIGDKRKWSLCYVRNFLLERGNEFSYPLHQISYKRTLRFKSSRRDYIIH